MIGIQNMMGLGKQLVFNWVVPRNINFKKKKKINTKFASTNLVGGAVTILKENCKWVCSKLRLWLILELDKRRGWEKEGMGSENLKQRKSRLITKSKTKPNIPYHSPNGQMILKNPLREITVASLQRNRFRL